MKFFVGGRVASSSDHMKNANLRVDELIMCIGLDKFVDILMVQDDTGQTPLHLTAVNSNGAFLLKQLLRPLKGHIKLCAILNVRTSSGSTRQKRDIRVSWRGEKGGKKKAKEKKKRKEEKKAHSSQAIIGLV